MTFRKVDVHDAESVANAIRDLGDSQEEVLIDRAELKAILLAQLNRMRADESGQLSEPQPTTYCGVPPAAYLPTFMAHALGVVEVNAGEFYTSVADQPRVLAAGAAAIADAMVEELRKRCR